VTVGYGDVRPYNTIERGIAIILMFTGAFTYSYIVGSLSSIILSMDARSRKIDDRLNTLIEIRQKYKLDHYMFNKIKKSLKYGNGQNEESKLEFLNLLPQA